MVTEIIPLVEVFVEITDFRQASARLSAVQNH